MYDILYVSPGKVAPEEWKKFSSKYPRAHKVENIQSFNDLKKKSFTKLFWVVWDNLNVDDNFNFDYIVSKWDTEYIHIWKNQCYDTVSYIGGICLFPKTAKVSNNEFNYRFYLNKKEINFVASKTRYPQYNINSYEEYLKILEETHHPLFWNKPTNIQITNPQIFDLYFDPKNGKYDHDRTENHVFLNGKFYDGIALLNKNKPISKKEFDFRFIIKRKEWDTVVSVPQVFDIIFISYSELNAETNWLNLKTKFSRSKRVSNVTGIHQAHIEAAKLSETPMFWVVDGDAEIKDDFNFITDQIPFYNRELWNTFMNTVHVWSSQNPINELIYGYGGVKLLPKQKTLEMNLDKPDIATSISDDFKIINEVSNLTRFDVDEFTTWRSAFRECAKLASKIIDRTYDEETEIRLETWCTVGEEKPLGSYCIAGAKAGRNFGYANIGNKSELIKINDFDWLRTQFNDWKLGNG
jgi:hypothetical protein